MTRKTTPESQGTQTRRLFLKETAAGLMGTTLSRRTLGIPLQEAPPPFRDQLSLELKPVASLVQNVTRTWIGPACWANRLQDWRLHQGRIECLTGKAGDEVRTVALLTRELKDGAGSAHLSVRAGLLEEGKGFCGFLIGAGRGQLDYRAAALVQKASGIGGGLLCVYESDGRISFREHEDEEHPLAFAKLPVAETFESAAEPAGSGAEVLLRLDILPQPAGGFELRLAAWEDSTRRLLAAAILRDVKEEDILGGIALVSSPHSGVDGARYWFRDVRAAGDKIAEHPDRALGPILGSLYSLSGSPFGSVLKISAQLVPLAEIEPQAVRFQYRAPEATWKEGPEAQIEPGFTAHFRIPEWDSSRHWEYRLVYVDGAGEQHFYPGIIRRNPGKNEPLTIGLFSCVIASARSLEGGVGRPELPGAELLGRYTSKNIYFPHRELVANASRQGPDLLVFAGDQLYEGSPTRRDNSDSPVLDYLYKWCLWVWSFREMTRNAPAIVLVDDHDMYHGNIWGNGGRPAPDRDQNRGGYRCTADFVNLVQRTQCGHNPDPFDPTPVLQGITVYYGAFRYGCVSFAILEDRKFKTAPLQGTDLDVHEAELLGERQEKFLEEWGKDWEGVCAKICLTQTLFACVQTSPNGRPLLDFDSNGYPKPGRDRAIELLREAKALVLAGDQHLASLARHGLESFTDGVVQFTGPAGGTSWQRWFEPARPLPNAGATCCTGDFVDAWGNKVRVLAVANPKVSFAEYRKYRSGRGQGLGDRRLKSEGYGIVRVDPRAREFAIECWPWNMDPAAPDAQQFEGWPYRLPFDACDGRSLTANQ